MPTVAPLDLAGHCVAAGFVGDVPHFCLADGTIHRLDHGDKVNTAHDGLLAAAFDPLAARLVTSGEDGTVRESRAHGSLATLAEIGRKWITAVACGPQGAVAFASGRTACVRFADGTIKEFVHPRSVEGIAFAPKGMRIGVARYNGATLIFPAAEGKPLELQWDGAHTGITFSPDGNFVVTVMQENALHGWKLADGKHMRMTGYPAKVKSLSWSARGRWLASSGAPAAIVWPFTGKDGPMGKAPLELGTRGNTMVTSVACHPADDIVAIGYADGMVLAARFADRKEVLLRRAGKGAITGLGWDREGRRAAFGAETGECGVIDISA
jgi:WD40 repeat protein